MDRTYLITGASRGIGRYLLHNIPNSYGIRHSSKYPMDLPKVNILKLTDINDWLKNIDLKNIVLINCAGVNYNSFAHKADFGSWGNVINVNLKGTFNMIGSVLPIMREQWYGRIINIGSVVAKNPQMGTSAYAASKSGLEGLTKAVARENAQKGITCNLINLGYFNTGMINEIPLHIQDQLKKDIPYGDFGEPVQILNTINWLIENDYVNGSSIDINGGL